MRISTQSKIYDGVFLRRYLTAFSRELLPQKRFIVDVRQGSKYVSEFYVLIHPE